MNRTTQGRRASARRGGIRAVPACGVVLATALVGGLATSAGPAHAFAPDGHWNAVEDALRPHIQPRTLKMLFHADDVSDHPPYWSDGQAHCDDFDHFTYRHEFRVRDFELKEGEERPDTKVELRASRGYYYDFQTARSPRRAADLQLLGCVQYAFDRVNLAVHLARGLLDTSGKQNPATLRDVRCREVPGRRYGGTDEEGRYWVPSWNKEYKMRPYSNTTEPFFTDELKPNPKCNVIEQLGRGLHAVQDFYAHSNWADSEITTDTPDFAYSKKIGTWANPKGLKHTTPFPLFDFARLGVKPVDHSQIRPASLAGTGWRQFPPRLEAKKKVGLRNSQDGRLFYLSRFDDFRRQYLKAHRNRYPLSETAYSGLQSGCYTEQTILGNRICWEERQLGHYGFDNPEREKAPWALSYQVAGLAKDTLTGTTDRAAADLKTGVLPRNVKDAENKQARSNYANAVAVATADTARQWKYFQERLAVTYGKTRATKMIDILTHDQTAPDHA